MTTDRSNVSSAQILAWSSVLLAFGITQGVIYLRSFWGRFGLDPFQFSNASDLAIVGLTGIGVTLAFMAAAALLGGYLGSVLAQHVPKSRTALVGLVSALVAGLIALAIHVDFGIYLLLGMLLTWVLVLLIHHSPDIPERFKHIRILGYAALAVAYIPMASHFFGQHKANAIQHSDSALILSGDRASELDLAAEELRFVGRLGGEYIFYSPVARSVTVLQGSSVERLTLRSARKPAAVVSPDSP